MLTMGTLRSGVPEFFGGKLPLFLVVVCAALTGLFAMFVGLWQFMALLALTIAVAWMLPRPQFSVVVGILVLYLNLGPIAVATHAYPAAAGIAFFVLLSFAAATYVLLRRQPFVIDSVFWMMVLYAVSMLVSSLFSSHPGESLGRVLVYALEGIVLYLLLLNCVRERGDLRRALVILLCGAALLGAMSTYQFVTGDHDQHFWGLAPPAPQGVGVSDAGDKTTQLLTSGPLGERNHFGQILVMILPMAVALLFVYPKNRTLLMMAGAALISGLLLTFSRGAFLAAVIVVLAMIPLRWLPVKRALAMGVVGLLLLPIFLPAYVERLQRLTGIFSLSDEGVRSADISIRGRATENLAALRIFADHPIVGVGPGQTKFYTAQYDVGGFKRLIGPRKAHSMYLATLGDLGIVGGMAFFSLIAFVLWRLLQAARALPPRSELRFISYGLLLSLLAFLVTALFLDLAYERYLWMLVGLAGAAVRMSETELQSLPVNSPRVSV